MTEFNTNFVEEHIKLLESDTSNASANEKGSSMTPEEIKKLPDVSQLSSIRGKNEGEVKVFRDNNKPVAYSWKLDHWDFIGDVVGKDQANKSPYEGDGIFEAGDYDKIFFIDWGDGQERKLP